MILQVSYKGAICRTGRFTCHMPIPQGVNKIVRAACSRQVNNGTDDKRNRQSSFESLADGSIQFETGNSKAWYYQVSLK